ncbi:hypothetical protein, variant, partial [Saprolegnia diclina VS20]|uniref:FYVE zinc finger domain-containing protein n=1 Tax=Saprolegnia diclina (strain VS20) TaxID=1156394 RepID=T0RF68_SAPDV|eukprot:XP_008615666.1 hypothetical protein SDRG_11407 [Saprolegnia diclina VS20]
MSLPLPRDFFDCRPLPQSEEHDLLDLAAAVCHDTALNALTMAQRPPSKEIINEATKRRATLHFGTDLVDPAMYGLTGVSRLRTTIDELVDFLLLTTPEKVRIYGNVVGQAVLDRMTLYQLPPRDSSMLAASVQWAVIENPFLSSALTLKRDTCFLEVLQRIEVTDPATGQRRRGLVRATHSVAMDSCPSLRKSHNIVRGALIRSGHLFLEAQDGEFDYYYTYIVADPGSVPKFVSLRIFQKIVSQMLNVEHHFALTRLPALMAEIAKEPRRRFKPDGAIAACEACASKFSVFGSKRHCYKCHQVVCSACIQTYAVRTQ